MIIIVTSKFFYRQFRYLQGAEGISVTTKQIQKDLSLIAKYYLNYIIYIVFNESLNNLFNIKLSILFYELFFEIFH